MGAKSLKLMPSFPLIKTAGRLSLAKLKQSNRLCSEAKCRELTLKAFRDRETLELPMRLMNCICSVCHNPVNTRVQEVGQLYIEPQHQESCNKCLGGVVWEFCFLGVLEIKFVLVMIGRDPWRTHARRM